MSNKDEDDWVSVIVKLVLAAAIFGGLWLWNRSQATDAETFSDGVTEMED